MRLHVHLAHPPDAPARAVLEDALDRRIRLTVGPEQPTPADYQILVAGRPTAEALAASLALEAVVIPFAGVPGVTRERLAAHPGVALHNLHHNAAATAELALGLLLAAARHLCAVDRGFRDAGWSAGLRGVEGLLLDGRTALVAGHGAIGRRVCRALVALGMDVHAVGRRAGAPACEGVRLHAVPALAELLPRADVVVLCLPEGPGTTPFLGAEELAALPAHAVLVNVGRGSAVAEQPLYEALRDGRLGAAGLDVWYRYPGADGATEPSAFPFGTLDNVVMSPHRGGRSDRAEVDRMTHLARLLNAAAAGRPMPNAVDLTTGY